MNILHGTWIPHAQKPVFQSGDFFLWVETSQSTPPVGYLKKRLHPNVLSATDLLKFVSSLVGSSASRGADQSRSPVTTKALLLPSTTKAPMLSPELSRILGQDMDGEELFLHRWNVSCFPLDQPIRQLDEMCYLAKYETEELILGSDFLFWAYWTHRLRQLLLNDQFLPYFTYMSKKSSRNTLKPTTEIYPGWQFVGEAYEQEIRQIIPMMPQLCCATATKENSTPNATNAPLKSSTEPMAILFDKETLIRHFAEVTLCNLVSQTPLPIAFLRKMEDSLLETCLQSFPYKPLPQRQALPVYRQWLQWKHTIVAGQAESGFLLGFRLHEGAGNDSDDWWLELLVIAKEDPSLTLSLADYWAGKGVRERQKLAKPFGEPFETQVLRNLGYAARMYPQLWQAMESNAPGGMHLLQEEALNFLQEGAWLLENAGFRVIVPSWWTPQGRRRLKIRMQSTGQSSQVSSSDTGKHFVSLNNLIQYQFELAIGDEAITPAEWQRLIQSKSPLIHFRGQWMALDQSQMQQMLTFWEAHGQETPDMSIQELLHKTADDDDIFSVDPNDALASMLTQLRDTASLTPIDPPDTLKATLRPYQKRGLAWLHYLEKLGMNGCLADDMGLGKTIQVIALLVLEQQSEPTVEPTLLIVPTSVIGNWQKETERFAPHLKAVIHHGSDRANTLPALRQTCSGANLVISSYALARKDINILKAHSWKRVVLDEAQNIKNPKAAQTRAILKLPADHRLALTGTPVENRLLDLWSIFQFLNPGYLNTHAKFRRNFEKPIQKEQDPRKSRILKRLVEPFILRRLKTDRDIIQDLPDKLENKLYCNLSKEQASLYEVVVKDVKKKLQDAEGIQRKGLMLSTLMQLKQICNHPMQFLKDGSPFTENRSHKLSRLREMLEESLAEGDSVLIFSQFTEICQSLETFVRQTLHANVYYLHGGTARQKREKMISTFQNPETPPSIFILSLKAGGVGITLTKANHVFHFDRWWNPAVENQATDRAFRIGQNKTVFAHKFITLGTLEERIDEMIEAKKQVADSIIGNDESWLSNLNNATFTKLIALNKQLAVVDE